MRVWPGNPSPLGAAWDGEGVNFALYSENATGVELCLFDRARGGRETHRIPVIDRSYGVWHCYLPDVRPGQLYGYRVHGPYAPQDGHRFNPNKLLIDPYAKAITGGVDWNDAVFGFKYGEPEGLGPPDDRDSGPYVPKCVVIESAFSWGDDRPPRVPWSRTFIYECHVKGLTARHPEVPEHLRGTYLGLVWEPIIDHLQRLGVTAVELMPVHHALSERGLVERGLTNYWGYNSIGFFAPDVRFATGSAGQQVSEFKTMVKRLHGAGIEVILDVVYNHTAEGNHLGPTLSLRGIDNATYYRLVPDAKHHYVDYTGCGNSLNMLHARTIQIIMDSLRYWVQEMHVDGFRFDLAPALARELHEVNRLGRFFAMIQQDPVLSNVKLIAEPWDLGEGGYQVGNFPGGWAEWNGKYRDAVRRFWRGDEGVVPELAYRLSGSSDVYRPDLRSTFASINFVACHDGMTLHDLTAYERKHNEANGEHNRDGHDENYSANWGVEGPTDDPVILDTREQIKRCLLATLALSQGVPMITAGDELGRTQMGNNNAYCQDNELSWVDWRLDERRQRFLQFAVRLFAIRRNNPVLRRRSFFRGVRLEHDVLKDLAWIREDGEEMTVDDWHDPRRFVLGMLIPGQAADEVDERGRRIEGNTLLLVVNAGADSRSFRLPTLRVSGLWREVINTARPARHYSEIGDLTVPAHTLILLEYDEVR